MTPPPNLVRLVALLRTPSEIWRALAAETPAPRALMIGLVAPLALAAAAFPALVRLAFGESVLGTIYRPPIVDVVFAIVAGAILGLAAVAAVAATIDRLAPAFEGERSFARAFALAAYASAPAFTAAILAAIPGLWIAAGIGLYAVWLLYLGLPIMMRCPPDRSLAYATTATIAALVALGVAAALTACVAHAF